MYTGHTSVISNITLFCYLENCLPLWCTFLHLAVKTLGPIQTLTGLELPLNTSLRTEQVVLGVY